MNLKINPLTCELIPHYLDFFDNRAFSEGNPNGPCYCTSPSQDEATIRQMVSGFKVNGVKETIRKYAVEGYVKMRKTSVMLKYGFRLKSDNLRLVQT